MRKHRNMWLRAGRPRHNNNIAFSNYKAAKREFRKALRRKAYEHEMNEFTGLTNIFDLDRCSFQRIMSRKRKKSEHQTMKLKENNEIVTDTNKLLSIWKKHYVDLYTPMENPKFDSDFKTFVESKINEYTSESWNNDAEDPLNEPFELSHVTATCSKLPNGKSGGPDGLVYEHIKYAGIEFYIILTKLFNSIREIEQVPDSSTTGIIVSLFKGKKKSPLNKTNYRGITLLNVFGKVFESLILDRMMAMLERLDIPHSLQFAYQTGKNCVQASFTLQESVLHNVERGSKVYTCFLDSTKAFDTVWFDGLFYKLYNIGIRGKTWRLLRSWYSRLSSQVIVNNVLSEDFPIKQGIRQGGVLSPWLFMCYNNDIPAELQPADNGLMVDDLPCGGIVVADDVALLSTRVVGLQAMLDSLCKYSRKWRFEFNPGKTVVVTFGESNKLNATFKTCRQWHLGSNKLREERSCEHVGAILSGDFSNKERCEAAAKKGKEVVSCLLSSGARPGGLNPICGVELWRLVGLPRMLYGAELWWELNKTDMEKLEIANRFAAKRMQGLITTTRSAAAIGSLGLYTVEGYIDKMKLMFLHQLLMLSPESSCKMLLVKRLLSFKYALVKKPLGFIPDVIRVLNKYGLHYLLDDYIENGIVPTHCVWRKDVLHKIQNHQLETWRNEIQEIRELEHYGSVHNNLEPLQLWNVAKRNPFLIMPISNLVKILCGNIPSVLVNTVQDNGEFYTCNICNMDHTDIAMHFIMNCKATAYEREKIIQRILDTLEVRSCAAIFIQDDIEIYRTYLSGFISGQEKKQATTDSILEITSVGIFEIIQRVSQIQPLDSSANDSDDI